MSRITGLATGLDIDSLVEETMNAYQTKIDAIDQQKQIAELQQELYRDVIKECRDFYNDYFDITKSDSLLKSSNWVGVSFSSSSSAVTVTANSNVEVANYTVNVTQLATAPKYTLKDSDLLLMDEIYINGNKIDLKGKDIKEKKELIKQKVKDLGLNYKESDLAQGIIISSDKVGKDESFTINGQTIEGTNCHATIEKDGSTYVIDDQNKCDGNKITLDGVTFQFNNITTSTGQVQITGKTDVSSVKDTIVKFVNDYNNLLEKLNTLVNEKRDTDYMPLTDAQKKEMSESEIELWEKKVKEGQLSRDSDLKRIISGMKSAMNTMISGVSTSSGKMNLSSIGISLVSDYSGAKAGTLKIDEDKLDAALENNLEDVKKLFTNVGTKNPTNNTYTERGLMYQLKDLFDKETQTSSGTLLKKAGMEGESTLSNNTLSKKIDEYKNKIELMNSIFKRKQQALYTKYASLETAMNNMNSQISYLQSYSS